MALESLLVKVRTVLTRTGLDSLLRPSKDAVADSRRLTNVPPPPPSSSSTKIGVLSFEVASLMSKLLHIWRSLSSLTLSSIATDGVLRIVSSDPDLLLSLSLAEISDSLRLSSSSLLRLSLLCSHPTLRRFPSLFSHLERSGSPDPNHHHHHRWILSSKEMDVKSKRMDRFVSSTASLYKKMEELSEAEHVIRRFSHQIETLNDAQRRVLYLKQEVKYLKETSLWGKSFDSAVSLLAPFAFTLLFRIGRAFRLSDEDPPPAPPRISVSSAVHPSPPQSPAIEKRRGVFELGSAILSPPPSTLGFAGLGLHYANLIVVIERMVRSPRLIGSDARDDLYGMLTGSLRAALRERLRGVATVGAGDAGLAEEWRSAVARILDWLSPLAHAMIRWQADRSFDRRRSSAADAAAGAEAPAKEREHVMLVQTLHYANTEKAEAAIVELLVGLNYLWRFEMEMSAKGLSASSDGHDRLIHH
ncbi:hypothetical protein QJS04_geneDACA020622 [Acorus gramineus]|uniref:Uncharacterized protein n=1 Tax=Acorus gramineus TaxID=55184 RepID=A0AAV9B743_ACOGR|nr:hypothetical protein QJS04_geneDACA020622 [Acorus gramineus]